MEEHPRSQHSGNPVVEKAKTRRPAGGTPARSSHRKTAESAPGEGGPCFRLLFDLSPLGVALISLNFRFLRANAEYCRITGYPPEEMATLDFPSVTHPEDREADLVGLKRLLAGEIGLFEKEKRCTRKDGQVIWVKAHVRGIRDEEGRLLCLPVFIEDITEHRKTGEALKAQEALLRHVLGTAPVGVWFIDGNGRIVLVNEEGRRIWGGTRTIGIGEYGERKGWWAHSGKRIEPREWAEARAIARGEISLNEEIEIEGFDGSRRIIMHSAVPARDEGGRVTGAVVVSQDITERKRMEEALRRSYETLEEKVRERTAALVQVNEALLESEERFRSLVESSLVGFFIVQKGQIVFSNPEQKRLFGGCWKECAVSEFRCIHPADRDRFVALCDGRLIESAGETEMVVRQCPDGFPEGRGGVRWLHGRATPIRYKGEKAILVNMVDITQLKEIERVALTQEKMAALGQVAAGIAHEIRNPLSGLNIYLDSLKQLLGEAEGSYPEVREKADAVIASMQAASAKMDSIIQRVLSFSRPGPPRMEPLDINLCIRDAVEMAKVSLRKAGVRVAVALREDLHPCRGDAQLLEQVLLNLMLNAAQAMEGQDGERMIEIGSSRASHTRWGLKHATISVADSGPGVPEELREKVFDPFFTTKGSGTGIGLSITQKIVSDHGGFIRVGTSRWGGALFTICLPVGSQGDI